METTENKDKELINASINGDAKAKKQLVNLVDPIINMQTKKYCRRFCKENRSISSCTIFPEWKHADRSTPLCEWGNGSYGWMLEYLTKPERLAKYEGRDGAQLIDYWYVIATSYPFYDHWKNWRFNRRIRAPKYIIPLDPHASHIFLLLCSQVEIIDIAQRLNLNETEVKEITQRIMAELLTRKKLYLLDSPKYVSLSDLTINDDEDNNAEYDVPDWDDSPEHLEEIELIKEAWKKLNPIQQFVLQAMDVDYMSANEVLDALVIADYRILPNKEPKDVNRQQLYYYRKKTLIQLSNLVQQIMSNKLQLGVSDE